MNISDIDNKPYFQAVEPGSVRSTTKPSPGLPAITQSELLALNPAFNVPAFIPKNKRKLLLPVASVQTFQSNYLNAAPDSLFSWEVYTPAAKTSLSDISTATGMSIADIKRLNNLNGNLVNAGRSILVAKNGKTLHTASESVVSIDIDNTPDTYRSNICGRHSERQHCPNPTRRRTDSGHYRRTFAARNRPYATRSPCPHCRTRPCDSRSATSNRKTDCHAV